MREINFRAWDKTEKRMKLVVMLDRNMDNPDELIEVHTWPIAIYMGGYRFKQENRKNGRRGIDEIILLFPTGLKDNDETEIYEGDIVRFRDTIYRTGTSVIPVEFKRGVFTPFHAINDEETEFEVIGNIYENPVLLEKAA